MGLDMFLYLRKFESLSKYDYKEADKEKYEKRLKNFYPKELTDLKNKHIEYNFLSKSTTYKIGYWRKANAIHNWFVENCAGGEDDCSEVYVSRQRLEELRDLCQQVMDEHTKAQELLPTKDGFFFGSQKYDDWYFEGLKYTIELLNDVLKFLEKNHKCYDVIYEASW